MLPVLIVLTEELFKAFNGIISIAACSLLVFSCLNLQP
jgi:hypothetical protein